MKSSSVVIRERAACMAVRARTGSAATCAKSASSGAFAVSTFSLSSLIRATDDACSSINRRAASPQRDLRRKNSPLRQLVCCLEPENILLRICRRRGMELPHDVDQRKPVRRREIRVRRHSVLHDPFLESPVYLDDARAVRPARWIMEVPRFADSAPFRPDRLPGHSPHDRRRSSPGILPSPVPGWNPWELLQPGHPQAGAPQETGMGRSLTNAEESFRATGMTAFFPTAVSLLTYRIPITTSRARKYRYVAPNSLCGFRRTSLKSISALYSDRCSILCPLLVHRWKSMARCSLGSPTGTRL